MTTSAIPTDLTEINAEINELLDVTSQSTERGRLFWLIKAALDHQNANASGEQAPFTLGEFTMQADTATAAQVSAPGGLAFVSGSDRGVRISYENSGSLDISLVFAALNSSGKQWRLGLVNTGTDVAASYPGTVTTQDVGASGVITFASHEDIAESSFPVGATVKLLLIPEAAAASGGATLGGAAASRIATLTYSNAFVTPNSAVPDGSFGFTDTNPQALDSGDAMTVSLNDSGGDSDQSLATFAFLYNIFGSPFVIQIVPEGELPTNSNTITQLVTISSINANGFSFIFQESNFARANSLTNDDDYDIYVVPLQPYNEGALLGAPIDRYRVTTTDTTPSSGQVYVNNAALNSITSLIINTGGNALENAKVRSLNGDTILVAVGALEHLFSVTNVQNTSSTLTTLTVSALGGNSTTLNNNSNVVIAKF